MTIEENKIRQIEVKNNIKRLNFYNIGTVCALSVGVISTLNPLLFNNSNNLEFAAGTLLVLQSVTNLINNIEKNYNFKDELKKLKEELIMMKKSETEENDTIAHDIVKDYGIYNIERSEAITQQMLNCYKEEQKTNTITR